MIPLTSSINHSCLVRIIRNSQSTKSKETEKREKKGETNMMSSTSSLQSSSPTQCHNVHNVFVYGSLMADDVVRALLHRLPLSSSAVLHGFHRYSIKERVYPAILPVENKKVAGRVLMGITDPELYILDVFEDVEYERNTVEVSLTENTKNLQVHTYVWSNKDDPNLYGEWDFEEWKRVHMKDFVDMTFKFMEELDLPESKTRVATYDSFYQQDGESQPAS